MFDVSSGLRQFIGVNLAGNSKKQTAGPTNIYIYLFVQLLVINHRMPELAMLCIYVKEKKRKNGGLWFGEYTHHIRLCVCVCVWSLDHVYVIVTYWIHP